MFLAPTPRAVARPRTPRRAAAALSTALIATLATMPAATAVAAAGPGGGSRPAAVRPAATPGELLTSGELQKLLASLPLQDLSAAQLAQYLAGLEGVSKLAGLKAGLLGEQLGAAGLEQGLSEAIEELKVSDPTATLGELANLKSPLEGKLGGLLKTLGGLLLPAQQKALEEALGSLNLSSLNLNELASTLLGSTHPGEPLAGELATLAGGLFGEVNAEGTLGTMLGGATLTGSFAPKSVQQVSEELKSTPEAVSGELGQTTAQLPATTTMLTAPLSSGQLAGVAPAAKGLITGVLGDLDKGGGEGSGKGSGGGEGGSGSGEGKGGSGSGEGKGGSGEGKGGSGGAGEGQGGSGGSSSGGQGGPGGAAGSTTVVVTLPGASAAQGAGGATAAKAAAKADRVRILSHRVRGGVATVVVQAPAAGRVTLAGWGVRPATGRATKAGKLTLRVRLSKTGTAAAHRARGHRMAVRLEVSFKPTHGSSSAASTTVELG
jgi:hypothetical protein